MAAPKENQFWKLRSKHGRDLIFTSPLLLWEAASEYFETTTARTDWDQQEWVGKDGKGVTKNVRTPFTLTGMFIFLDITRTTWDEYKQRKDYSDIITRIEQVIYTQKFEGAATGHYNANIIARDLGLRDKQDIEHAGEIKSVQIQVVNVEAKIARSEKEADV